MAFKSSHLLMSLVLISPLSAATNTWTGSFNGSWINSSNWSAGVPVAGADLVFPNGAGNFIVDYSGVGVTAGPFNTINIDGGASAYFFSGGVGDVIKENGTVTFTSPPGSNFGGELRMNGSSLTILALTPATISAVISETTLSSILNVGGNSTLTLSGTNTYTGGTTVGGGTLAISGDSNLGGGNSVLLLANGTLQAVVPFTITSHPIHLNGTGTFDTNGSDLTINTPISDGTISGGLTKVNGGTLILNGATSYTGATLVSGGVLQGNLSSLHGDITNNAAVSFDIDVAGSGTYAGIMSGTGNVTKENTGTLTLSGSNSYTGATVVNGGTLGIFNAGNLGTNGTLFLNASTTLQAEGTSTTLNSHPITLNGSASIDSNGKTFTIGSPITGFGTTLTKIGAGTLNLTGINNPTFTGPVTVNAGTLAVSTDDNLGIAGILTLNTGTTLQAANAATTINNHAITLNGPTTFDSNGNSLNIGSTISGTGSLTKINAGTLNLTGANNYSGGTTVSGGTLEGTTAGLQGNITNNSIVILDVAGFNTYSGVMSGSGSLTVQGGGTLTLSGANTYSGGTTAISTTLNGNATSIQGNISTNSSVIFNQLTNGTYAGAMSGTGSLTKNSAGTLILTGTNSYSGGTFLNAGTLQGTTSSLQGDITDIGTVVFDQTGTGTYAGAIFGPGDVTKQNTGTVSFTGANTYGGQTNVLAGTLAINGGISGSGVMVSPGATLGGTGTINAPVTVNGTLSPGNSIGTITVNSQVTFNSGSTFKVEINPTASDLLNVVGAGVTINQGATLNLIADPGTYSPTKSYLLIQTTGGISGTFSPVITNSLFLHPTLTYTANDLLLMVTFIKFTDLVGTKGNVGAVANCLDNSNAATGSDISNVILALQTITDIEELKEAINQLQPSLYTGYALSQENMSIRVRSMISKRMASLSQNPCLKTPCHERKWTLWADGLGDWSNQHREHHQFGFHTASGAGALGVDYQVAHNFFLGFSGAYSATDIDWNHNTADGGVQSYYGTLYGTWSSSHFFIEAVAMGAHNSYTGKRRIEFATVDRHARNEHAGNEALAHLSLGGLFQFGCVSINPFISSDYIFLHQNGFKEHGSQSLNLRIDKTRTNYLRAEGGVSFNGCFEREHSRWVPQLKLGVIREWRFNGGHYRSKLTGADCTFSTTGLNPDRTLFSPGTSLTALFFNEQLCVELGYDAEFGRKYWDQNVNLQLSYAF